MNWPPAQSRTELGRAGQLRLQGHPDRVRDLSYFRLEDSRDVLIGICILLAFWTEEGIEKRDATLCLLLGLGIGIDNNIDLYIGV